MCVVFFFQAEDGIRDLVRSRGLGDVYKRQVEEWDDEQLTNIRNIINEMKVEGALRSEVQLNIKLSLIHI